MAALHLAGIILNLRMLRSCFKDKIKYTFLQKCRTLAICQCSCQVTILVVDAVESWKGLETQPRESCEVFRVLSNSMLFFQGCNFTAIFIIYFDQPTAHGTRKIFSKLKISATLCVGFLGFAMIWWYSCFSQQLYSHYIALTIILMVMVIVTAAFAVLVFAANASGNSNQDTLENTIAEASMNTFSLCSKLKISSALSLGFTGSLIWWYNCFAQEFLFQMVLRVVFAVSLAFAAFVFLLFACDARNIIHDQVEDDTQLASMRTYSLLWKGLNEHRRPVFFMFLLLVFLIVIVSWSPLSAEVEVSKGVLYLVITTFVVGIVLPVTFTDLIELSKEEENRLKTVII